MRARYVVLLLVAALAVYFVLIGNRGVYLVEQHRVILKVLGVAVLLLPLIGVVVVASEIRIGIATQRLAEKLDAEGAPPDPVPPRLASGRVDRAAAEAEFGTARAHVEHDPDDWRAWYRLAQAYDHCGDRKRAREAMRTAIELSAPN
jgi:Flp pilus assembly protein TadD